MEFASAFVCGQRSTLKVSLVDVMILHTLKLHIQAFELIFTTIEREKEREREEGSGKWLTASPQDDEIVKTECKRRKKHEKERKRNISYFGKSTRKKKNKKKKR